MDGVLGFLFGCLFLFVVPYLAIKWWRELRATKGELQEQKSDAQRLKGVLSELREKAEPLWQYLPIQDVDMEVNARRAKAENEVADLISAGQQEVAEAKAEAKSLRDKAREGVDRAEIKAASVVQLATSQAEEIVGDARVKAEEVAGGALLAKDNADEYESKAKAMKNLIKGYGDEYLVPNHSTIDDLADDFDHKLAGQELKAARAKSKDMIKCQR